MKVETECLTYIFDTDVTYAFTNRTADMRLNRAAFEWLEAQVERTLMASPSRQWDAQRAGKLTQLHLCDGQVSHRFKSQKTS